MSWSQLFWNGIWNMVVNDSWSNIKIYQALIYKHWQGKLEGETLQLIWKSLRSTSRHPLNKKFIECYILSGLATSFINEKNRNVAKDMVDLLNDTRQEVPGWLESLAFESHQNSGRNRQRRFDSIPLVCWLLFNPGPSCSNAS